VAVPVIVAGLRYITIESELDELTDGNGHIDAHSHAYSDRDTDVAAPTAGRF
jgi:hypothetical protein